MAKKKVPKRLWDFGLVYEGEIISRMSRGRDKRTGYEEVTGNTPDISEWLDFEFYDLVWWLDHSHKPNIADVVRRPARWLGVSHRVGSDLCYWLITETGQLISKTSVEHVTRDGPTRWLSRSLMACTMGNQRRPPADGTYWYSGKMEA